MFVHELLPINLLRCAIGGCENDSERVKRDTVRILVTQVIVKQYSAAFQLISVKIWKQCKLQT